MDECVSTVAAEGRENCKVRKCGFLRSKALRVGAVVGGALGIAVAPASAQFTYTPTVKTDIFALASGMIEDGIDLVLNLWQIAMPLLLLVMAAYWIWGKIR